MRPKQLHTTLSAARDCQRAWYRSFVSHRSGCCQDRPLPNSLCQQRRKGFYRGTHFGDQGPSETMFDARNCYPSVDCALKRSHLLLDRLFDTRDLGSHMVEILDHFVEQPTMMRQHAALQRQLQLGNLLAQLLLG